MRKFFQILVLVLPLLALNQVVSQALAQEGNERDLKPLSAADKARVEELLKSFDPRSYDIRFHHIDPVSGSVQAAQVGRAKGLVDVRQRERTTVKGGPVNPAAGTNTNVNVFKKAATNTNINVFKNAATNTNVNVFKSREQQEKAMEINAILVKYLR